MGIATALYGNYYDNYDKNYWEFNNYINSFVFNKKYCMKKFTTTVVTTVCGQII